MTTQGSIIETLPPHDIEAEESVLAACLLDAMAFGRVMGRVKAEDFMHEKNAIIYAAMLALYRRHVSIDVLTVVHELRVQDQLEKAGGEVYLSRLVNDLPTTIGVEDYADIVRRTSGLRRLIAYAGRVASEAYRSDDFERTAATAQQQLMEIVAGTQTTEFRTLSDVLRDGAMDEFMSFMQAPGENNAGIPTGINALDALLEGRGLLPGLLYIVAAQTSMGKSTFLRWVMLQMALAGHRVAIFSLEQNEQVVARELICAFAGFDRGHWERLRQSPPRQVEQCVNDAIGQLADQAGKYIHIQDKPGLTPSQVRAQITHLKAKHPDLEVVIIDYLHILAEESGYGRHGGSRADILADMVLTIRDCCRELGLACLMASQLNRQVAEQQKRRDYRPRLEHLRESGAIEFLSYCVMYLYRPDYYYERGLLDIPREHQNEYGELEPTRDFEIGILKQQLGQAGVEAVIKFDPRTRRFWEPASPALAGF